MVHLVTGASDGIGRQTALELAKKGASVLVHGRTPARAEEAVRSLRKENPKGDFAPVSGDFGTLKGADELARQVRELDVLVNNAGVFMNERTLSSDGFEMTMAVNHFAHFVLTHRLLPLLKAAPQGRIVNVASGVHASGQLQLDDLTMKKSWSGYGAYSTSKQANVLFSVELARRLKGTRVTVASLHPGVIKTKLLQTGWGAGGASLAKGAVTSVYCATAEELNDVTGEYFSDGRKSRASASATDPQLAREFYEESCRLTGVTPL